MKCAFALPIRALLVSAAACGETTDPDPKGETRDVNGGAPDPYVVTINGTEVLRTDNVDNSFSDLDADDEVYVCESNPITAEQLGGFSCDGFLGDAPSLLLGITLNRGDRSC